MPMRFQGFSGMAPRIDRRFLKDNQAQEATNCRVTSGALDALREPGLRHNPENGGILSMFRMVDAATGTERWLSWQADVDAQRSPVNGDTLQRVYWTGDGEPRASTFGQLFVGSGPYPGGVGSEQFVLGAFPPSAAPTVGHSGGSASNITIAFVYTFVTARGEESQPSPAGTHTAPSDATTWNLSGMNNAPANSLTVSAASWAGGLLTLTLNGTRGLRADEQIIVAGLAPAALNGRQTIAAVLDSTQITIAMANPGAITDQVGTVDRVAPHNYGAGAFKRIYATVTGANGVAEFRLWADNVGIGATTHSASYSATAIAAATLLPSTDWAMPPARMRGLYLMSNGIMVGFVDNDVCLSEPFLPHAWPVGYRQSVPAKIVAIGGFGTTIVIGTMGKPHTINGVEPQTMGGGAIGIEQPWPCLSKRGMTSADWGVLYPTTLGLAIIGPGGADIATRSLYTEEEWRVLNPSSFISATVDSLYAGAFTKADGVTKQVILLNKAEFSDLLLANLSVDEFWTDPTNGVMYLAHDGLIYRWDDPDSPKTLYDWFSKDVLLAPPQNFGAAKVDADFENTPEQVAAAAAAAAVAAAANQVLLNSDLYEGAYGLLEIGAIEIGGELMEMPPSLEYESLQFQLYACNERVFTKALNSERAFKLPAGFKCDTVAVRIAGNVKVRGVVLGSSMADLRGV
jgi:hypothetical protein